MEIIQQKTGVINKRPYWRFFLPLSLFLTLMVKFPLRIVLNELFYDALFYGAISLGCIATAIQIAQRVGKYGYRLIIVILLCSVLSGWQIFDLFILRTGRPPSVLVFGSVGSPNFSDQDGLAWYGLRFPNDNIMCHSLYERYFGNYLIAITLEIDRGATWFACGG